MDNLYPLEIDNYKNKDIIFSFTQTFDIKTTEAEVIFNETKKWLWLCSELRKENENGLNGLPRGLLIHQPLIIIDEMWHMFLLFTQEYKNFCDKYIGYFIHHFPSKENAETLNEDEMAAQLSYIYDKLGQDTLIFWYQILSKKYTPEVLRKIRI